MASYKTIQEAAERIKPYVKETPVLTSSTLNELAGGKHLFFKCEIFQKVGAFKFRGASNAVMKLTADEAKQGVVTHSSGNHAQALALAAKLRGIPAYVIMPKTAPVIKKKAVAGYGGKIYECEPNLAARSTTCCFWNVRTYVLTALISRVVFPSQGIDCGRGDEADRCKIHSPV